MLFDKLRQDPPHPGISPHALVCGDIYRIFAFRLRFFYLQIAAILRERTDEELLDEIEEFSALFGEKGIDEVKQTMILEAKEDGEKDLFYRLLGPRGKELGSSEMFSWGELASASPRCGI